MPVLTRQGAREESLRAAGAEASAARRRQILDDVPLSILLAVDVADRPIFFGPQLSAAEPQLAKDIQADPRVRLYNALTPAAFGVVQRPAGFYLDRLLHRDICARPDPQSCSSPDHIPAAALPAAVVEPVAAQSPPRRWGSGVLRRQ